MLEALGGLGLASAAGLNAYIPAIVIAVLDRYTDLVTLPEQFRFLSEPWVLATLIVLLLIEEVVDKIPGADHANDVVQSIVRPVSGAVLFAASASDSFSGRVWLALIVGFVMALAVHGTKAAGRGVVNVSTAGLGAPVVSVAEDVMSLTLSLAAILFPILILGFLIMFALSVRRVSSHRRRRRERSENGAADA